MSVTKPNANIIMNGMGESHLMPIAYEKKHELSTDCWCKPKMEVTVGMTLAGITLYLHAPFNENHKFIPVEKLKPEGKVIN